MKNEMKVWLGFLMISGIPFLLSWLVLAVINPVISKIRREK